MTLSPELLLKQLMVQYLDEVADRFDELENKIIGFQSKGLNEKIMEQHLHDFLRAVHSLKGNAGTYGLALITAISHALEDSIIRTISSAAMAQERIDLWLGYIDLMRKSREGMLRGDSDLKNYYDMLDTLRGRDQTRIYFGLLIESSSTVRRLCETTFKFLNVAFSLSDDGYEALGRLLRERFDILFTSLETPSLNALSLISALRASKTQNAQIPIVLITSSTEVQIPAYATPDLLIKKEPSAWQAAKAEVRTLLDKTKRERMSQNIDVPKQDIVA